MKVYTENMYQPAPLLCLRYGICKRWLPLYWCIDFAIKWVRNKHIRGLPFRKDDGKLEGENDGDGETGEGDDSLAAEEGVSQREADLLSQLSPEEVKEIMTSVMEDMVQGLQVGFLEWSNTCNVL